MTANTLNFLLCLAGISGLKALGIVCDSWSVKVDGRVFLIALAIMGITAYATTLTANPKTES